MLILLEPSRRLLSVLHYPIHRFESATKHFRFYHDVYQNLGNAVAQIARSTHPYAVKLVLLNHR